MSRLGNFRRFIQADASPECAAREWANAHFAESQRNVAEHVVLALSSVLCVPIQSIRPETDIVHNLKADEKWEWDMIMLHIQESTGRNPPKVSEFTGCTVLALVDFIATSITQK